jgi:hypothetical protein
MAGSAAAAIACTNSIGIVPIINFSIILFLFAVVIWQLVVIQDMRRRIDNSEATYDFNMNRAKQAVAKMNKEATSTTKATA